MKIKFEIKNKGTLHPLYTIFMEHKREEDVEFLITKFNTQQLVLPDKNPIATQADIPINDGLLSMNKVNLKKFIAALQLLAKS